jgi:hypothetical protein
LEKFKAAFCDDIYFHNERYMLNWAGKADAFKILQQRTFATLMPQPKLSINFDTTENVFIEGENLEVLKVLQKSYYKKIKCIIINDNELIIALTKMDLETATEIINLQPQKVLTLDRLFAGNDELKTNTALQMRDAGVEFKTI